MPALKYKVAEITLDSVCDHENDEEPEYWIDGHDDSGKQGLRCYIADAYSAN